MANETQQVVVEFILDTTQMKPGVEQLEDLQAIDKATAASFKATNAELAKRDAVLKATAASTKQATDATKKSIGDVNVAINNMTDDFMQGFQEGLIETLKEAGVTLEQFQSALGGSSSEVADLQKQISGLTDELTKLKDEEKGSVKEVAALRAQLEKLQDAYDKLTESEEETADKTETLKQRLKEITQELTLMKASGEDATNPERYQELVEEAGNLKDAFGDVNEEIARAGSDTKGLDSLIQVSQGIAGGFALAQGAAALFGDESEDLQEVLLKVNASMAILQGFQQLQALYAARATVAIGLQTAATTALTTAQTLYNLVVGTTTGLLKGLRIAFAATGIGLFVLALIEVYKWVTSTSKALRELTAQMEKNNASFETAIKLLDDYSEALKRNNSEILADLEAQNLLASELSQARIDAQREELRSILELEGERRAQFQLSQKALAEFNRLILEGEKITGTEAFKNLMDQHQKYVDNYQALEKRRVELASEVRKEELAREATLNEERLRSIVATTERAISLAAEGSAAQLELQKKLVRDKLELELQTQALTEQERLKIIQDANQQQIELQVAFNKRRIDLSAAQTEESLRGVEEGSRRELELRQELIRQQAASELATTKLSAAEREQVRRESLNEQLRLQLAFDAEQRRIAAEQAQQVRADLLQIATERNQALLATAREGTEERLQLEIFAIELAASEARRIAGENAVEIERINAESQAQISRVKAQFRQAEAESEIRIENAKNARIVRELQRTLSDERSTFRQRTQAIIELDEIQRRAIDRQKQNLRDQFADGLITQQEYNARYAELEDERAQISEDTNQRIRDENRAHTQALINNSIEVAGQLVGVLDSLFQSQANQEQARIEQQRRRVDELRESGAITEKEAERRRREIEQEERKAQQRQAEREKQIAVFRALLAIPSAFLQGTAQGGPILGAIYAAIAAAQAAIVISQPIPRFGKGKKDGYEGPAEVGETGSELVEKGGRMYIAKKRTVIYLGAKDKVYSPSETAKMLAGRNLQPANLPTGEGRNGIGAGFDYEKLGEVIRRNGGISLNIDGYKNFVLQGHAFTTYLNKRRGF